MTSPYLSPSSSSDPRSRTDSIFPIHLQDTGGIRKRSNSRSSRTQSISSANIERHPELLPDQVQDRLNLSSNSWTATKPSPRPQHQQTSLSSSSDAPSLQPASETLTLPGFQSLQNSYTRFDSTSRDSKETPHTTSADMASLSYLPPPHYGHMAFQDPSFDNSYQQSESHSHIHPSSNFGFIFGTSAPSQQSIYASGPLDIEPAFSAAPLEPSLNHVSEPTTMNNLNRAASPFHPSNYDSLEYPLAHTTSRTLANRSISHSPLSQHMDPLTPPLTAGLDSTQPQLAASPGAQASMDRMRSPSIYDAQPYSSSYAAPGVQTTQPLFPAPQSYSYPPPSAISARQQVPRNSSDSHSRGVVNQKPKPQCWEHGCNGREFSTFSNLLRHQREKSGTAAKSYCPKCGAEFTRTTARNGHLAHEKCSKQRRTSEAK